VEAGRRIGVLATLQTTLAPTVRLLRDTAEAKGCHREIMSCLCTGAFEAVLAGDVATHDRMVGASLAELSGTVDVIVLAQASMARVVANFAPEDRRIPILSSPELAVARAAEVMAANARGNASDPGCTPEVAGEGPRR
jgi:hypothetical protein